MPEFSSALPAAATGDAAPTPSGDGAAPAAPAPRFGISAGAARRIAEIVAADASGPDKLRVAVLAGGCSGLQYRFELTGATEPDDALIERDGARVLVDSVSLDLLAGAELDFADSLMGAHFAVRNPNATSSCGCGTSFSVD